MTRMYQVDDFDDSEPKTAEQLYREYTDDEREGTFLQDWDGGSQWQATPRYTHRIRC
jgi:hypothetical protein